MAMAIAPPNSSLLSYDQGSYSNHANSQYEDQIVPALRRRLAQESKELSKRISTHLGSPKDISTDDILGAVDSLPSSSGRPSLEVAQAPDHSRDRDARDASSSSKPFARKRTYSSPRPFETPSLSTRRPSGAVQQPPKAGRSVSSRLPAPAVHSRIPKPRSPQGKSSPKGSGATTSTEQSPTNVQLRLETISAEDIMMSEFPGQSSNHDRDTAGAGNGTAGWRHTGYSEDEDEEDDDFEQPEVEHWYRGEGRDGGGRNGGRGEIQAADQEMLAIALTGHIPADYRARDSWKADDPEHSDSQEPWRGSRRWSRDDDYVLDERMLTDMEDGDGTDHEPVDRSVTPTAPAVVIPNAQTPKSSSSTATPRPSTRTQPAAAASPSKRHVSPKPPNGAPSPPSTIRGTPTSTKTPNRGKRKMSLPPRSKPPASRSAYDLSSPALADAIPPWEMEPSLPPSGNWDEVVLPTIAKKMRMAQSDSAPAFSMLGAQSTPAARSVSSPVEMIPPAPGTFDYDASKANRHHQPNTGIVDQFGSTNLMAPPAERPASIIHRQTEPEPMMSMVVPPSTSAPAKQQGSSSAPPPTKNTPQNLRKTKPQIRVTSPSIKSRKDVEDLDSGGCCKCIIM